MSAVKPIGATPTAADPLADLKPRPGVRQPRLAGIDFNGSAWEVIEKHLRERVLELYKTTARKGIDQREADETRGAIAELERLISLGEKREHLPSDIY